MPDKNKDDLNIPDVKLIRPNFIYIHDNQTNKMFYLKLNFNNKSNYKNEINFLKKEILKDSNTSKIQNKIKIKKIILDPVMVAKGGAKLINPAAISFIKNKLMRKVWQDMPTRNDIGTDKWNQVAEHVNDNFFFIDMERYTLESVLRKGAELVKRKGIKCLVIDPFNKV
ncbi:MAG: bifunctional hydroxymethylpyrimidine kinase/phosphomethylpyrimidine kinase, partial [Saprospiraceae bacterium]